MNEEITAEENRCEDLKNRAASYINKFSKISENHMSDFMNWKVDQMHEFMFVGIVIAHNKKCCYDDEGDYF